MFKKLLSSMTIMLLAFCMSAGAQGLQAHKSGVRQITPKFGATPATSVLDIANNEMWIGYWDGVIDGGIGLIGMNQTPMQYDAAIGYAAGDGKIKGMEITGIKILFIQPDNVENLKIWMSTELPAKPEDADIVCDNVTDITDINNADDPVNEIRFSKSYKVDETKPLYIGYSFDINHGQADGDLYPILTDMEVDDETNAMLVKVGGEQGEWMDYEGIGFGVLAMQILVKGDFPENAVAIAPELPRTTALVNYSDFTFEIQNVGTAPVSNVTVQLGAYGFSTSTGTYDFDQPLVGYGSKGKLTVKAYMPDVTGVFQFFVKVLEVNGIPLDEPVLGESLVTVVSEKIARRPFVEEFTGMWCGWCPRGMVALEKLNSIYGSEVSAVAVHVGDQIECFDYSAITNSVGGFPSANLDRKYFSIDPYYGTASNGFGMGEAVEKAKEIIPVADVTASFSVDGDILAAEAKVNFLYSEDKSHFAVGYIVVEDGMQDPDWHQSNYYANNPDTEGLDPLFDPWINGSSSMSDIIFNDVAIAAKGIEMGLNGSIPSPINEEDTYINSTKFDASDYPAIQNAENLRLIALLFDTDTGFIVNTASVRASIKTSVQGVSAEDVVETARYAADGSIITVPQQGVNIVKYSDGTVRKVIVR